MNSILILSTDGTFNKIYNPKNGKLEIDKSNQALKCIEKKWLIKLNYNSIIHKDSLDFTDEDREFLATYICNCKYSKIVVIHGTDTINLSAKVVDSKNTGKSIIFTGAMLPFSIDPTEATANLALAIGFCNNAEVGVYIAMNGLVSNYDKVIKNRDIGKFEIND